MSKESVKTGVKFGLFFGLISGVSMGFGSYIYMPIPFILALYWFIIMLVESAIAGSVVGYLTKNGNA